MPALLDLPLAEDISYQAGQLTNRLIGNSNTVAVRVEHGGMELRSGTRRSALELSPVCGAGAPLCTHVAPSPVICHLIISGVLPEALLPHPTTGRERFPSVHPASDVKL